MQNLSTLRRSRSLTCFDLARLTGIPARMLAEAEYGMRQLSGPEHEQLALVFGLSEPLALSMQPVPRSSPLPVSLRQTLVLAALAASLGASALRPYVAGLPGRAAVVQVAAVTPLPQPTERLPVGRLAAASSGRLAAAISASPSATSSPSPMPSATSSPSPAAAPTEPAFFFNEQDGPYGCPLIPRSGQIVLNQGYGVGTHAPADSMGAVDLGVDSDGDGFAEPDASWNTVVIATHSGVVSLAANSWPAGNHIWVSDPNSGWRSGYAHLAHFLVEDGQQVQAGSVIGLVGSSGWSSGPHLHYHLWHNGVNVDPTELVVCRW